MKSLKITTAIALSSALLLTACGGNSGSSGDTKNPNASTESKTNALVGYWKSDCLYDKEDKIFYQGYVQWGKSNGSLVMKDMFSGAFNRKDCKGKPKFAHDAEDDPRGITLTKKELEKELKKVTFKGMNKLIVKEDGDVETLYRMQAKDFPKYNYTSGVKW